MGKNKKGCSSQWTRSKVWTPRLHACILCVLGPCIRDNKSQLSMPWQVEYKFEWLVLLEDHYGLRGTVRTLLVELYVTC